MTPRGIPITNDNADRLRTTLQLIASLPVASVPSEDSLTLLRHAVTAAKSALKGDDDNDPLCEVLREPEPERIGQFKRLADVVANLEFRRAKRNRCGND